MLKYTTLCVPVRVSEQWLSVDKQLSSKITICKV